MDFLIALAIGMVVLIGVLAGMLYTAAEVDRINEERNG